jgi:hypothetical protein
MSTTPIINTPKRRTSLFRDSDALEKENNVLRQTLKCHFCGGHYDHIANDNNVSCTVRLSLEQQGIIKKNNTRIKTTIRRREQRFVLRSQNPEVYERQKQQNSAHKASVRENEEYRNAERLRAQELHAEKQTVRTFRPHPFMNRIDMLRRRPDVLISEDVLEHLDATEDFLNPEYKKPEGEMYNRICKYLSFEYLTNNCCAVCERCKPKAFTSFMPVSDKTFLMRLRACVGFTPERRRRMPLKVQANYSVDIYDQRLKDIILSKYGLYRGSDKTQIDKSCFDSVEDMQLCICKDCKDDIVDTEKRNIKANVTPTFSPYEQSSGSDSETEFSRSQSTTSAAGKGIYSTAIYNAC